jgi:hypothetical protein
VDAAFFKGGTDDEGVAGGGEGPGEEALGLAGGDAEEVLQRGAAGDGEGGEFVSCEELAGAVNAVLAFGGGDGNGFVGTVFQRNNRRREVLRRRRGLLRGGRAWGLGMHVGWIEGEYGRGGGGGDEESAAREHGEIVG